MKARTCGYCGERCKGYAAISFGGLLRYYHHGDSNSLVDDEPGGSCYERAQREHSHLDGWSFLDEVMRSP